MQSIQLYLQLQIDPQAHYELAQILLHKVMIDQYNEVTITM